jgi:hypothetical protein
MAITTWIGAASVVTALGMALTPTPGLAADPVALQPNFRVAVRGVVPIRCSLTPATGSATFQNPQTAANTLRAETASLGFAVECNTGFALRMSSTNGALTQSDRPAASEFADGMAYEATLSLPGLPAVLGCQSATMKGLDSPCVDILSEDRLSDGVLSGQGQVDLRLISDGRPLLAGQYEDFLVVTLSPLMGSSGGAL